MQIKVKDTKMHKIRTGRRLMYNLPPARDADEITVAEGKLVLIEPTEQDLYNKIGLVVVKGWTYKPIIISETEKIEVGDWYLYNGQISQRIRKNPDAEYPLTHYHKTLALPGHFSREHLHAIVDDKLKDGDKVLVECEYIQTEVGNVEGWEGAHDGVWCGYLIKLNSYKHITLHRSEEKMYTQQQMDNALKATAAAFVQQIQYLNDRISYLESKLEPPMM